MLASVPLKAMKLSLCLKYIVHLDTEMESDLNHFTAVIGSVSEKSSTNVKL